MAMNNFNDLIKMKNLLMLMSAVLLILGGCSGNGASKDAGDDQFQLIAGTGHSDIGGAAPVEPLETIRLYEGVAPGSESWTHPEGKSETNGTIVYYNVSTPEMTVYLPDPSIATGAAMVVCPGGAFSILSYTSEGTMVANELCQRGIAAFVLKYRTTPIINEQGEVSNKMEDVMKFVMNLMSKSNTADLTATQNCLNMENSHLSFEDADRAISMVRENAANWKVNPEQIGIVGFSAGAVIAMHQALEHSEAGHPNFSGVVYGGWVPGWEAPADAAPLFVCSPTYDIFHPEECITAYQIWQKAKLPVELHCYSDCQHGFGAVSTGKSSDLWMEAMVRFMKDTGFLK